MKTWRTILFALILLALVGCRHPQPTAQPTQETPIATRVAFAPTIETSTPDELPTGEQPPAEAYPLPPTATPVGPCPYCLPAVTLTAVPPYTEAPSPTEVPHHTRATPMPEGPRPTNTPQAPGPGTAPTPATAVFTYTEATPMPTPTGPTPVATTSPGSQIIPVTVITDTETTPTEGICPPGFTYIDQVCWYHNPTTGDVFLKSPAGFMPPQPILIDISRERRMVLFAIIEKGRWTLYVARSNGDERRILLGPCDPGRELEARFSPEGRLAVIREFASRQLVGLYLADLEEDRAWKALEKPAGKTVEVWFAPGERRAILEVAGANGLELYLADGETHSVKNLPIARGLRRTAPLLFAPDGSHVIIRLEGKGKKFYAADCQTGRTNLLFETSADDWTRTILSPDGSTLAVYIARYEKSPQGMHPLGGVIHVISIETGQARLLAEGNITGTVWFSEDGRWLYFYRDGERCQVEVK